MTLYLRQLHFGPAAVSRLFRRLLVIAAMAMLAPGVALACAAPQCCITASEGQVCDATMGAIICQGACIAVVPATTAIKLAQGPSQRVPPQVEIQQHSLNPNPDHPPPKFLI